MIEERKDKKRFSSLKDLQIMLPRILKSHGNDDRLVLAASANPILAFESLGYSFTPKLRRELELRIRFGEERTKILTSRQNAIYKSAGESFDLDSPEELARVLKSVVRSQKSYKESEISHLLKAAEKPYLPQLRWGKQIPDPLEKFKTIHEIVALLLEYRQIETSEPRFASEEVFQKVYSGKRKIPVTKIRFRLQSGEQRMEFRNK